MYKSRDTDLKHIMARGECYGYGMGLGIILLDDFYPAFPGDVRNASGYPFPIQYEVIEGIDTPAIVSAVDKSPCLEPLVRAAKKLERLGCRAISAECGLFAYFQKEIAAAVQVPVFLSSLLQVSWAQQLIGPDREVGILVTEVEFLTDHHLEAVGVRPGSNYVVHDVLGIGRGEEFMHLWRTGYRTNPPAANYAKMEQEFLAEAVSFYHQYPTMGAMVLECTGFPPFARALQREVNIPIFSWGTLLDYAYSVIVHRDYYGHL